MCISHSDRILDLYGEEVYFPIVINHENYISAAWEKVEIKQGLKQRHFEDQVFYVSPSWEIYRHIN